MSPKNTITELIAATNAFDIDAALELFSDNAVIDDVSVGEKFISKTGVRDYLEKFFVGYKTKSQLLAVEVADKQTAKAKVDFTGLFGHETGGLYFTFDTSGLITKINAWLD